MALHYKTCTIQYAAKTDGTPATGYVEFKPNTVLTETDTGIILNDYAIVGYLDETGKVTVSLLVCDSPGVEPTGWSWNIEEKIDGGSVWWFQIFDSMEEPINLKDLYIPGSVPPTVAVQGPKGDTGDKGDKGDTGPQGPEGPEGQAAVIVGNFDRDPADLPPDGYVPANWDSPGKPPADTQILVGQAFLYNPNGHLWSFVGQTVVVEGWQDIGMIVGPQGEKGETGPLSPEDIIAGANITVVINANDTVTISAPTPVVDHGNLQGLADDDHTQYHNNTRGDARYDAKGAGTAAVAAHVALADPHTQYLTADDAIPPEVAVQNDAPTAEGILLWVDPDAPSNPNASFDDLDARYVNVNGDTMTGPLSLATGSVATVRLENNVDFGVPTLQVMNVDGSNYANIGVKDPTHAVHAATKGYVDPAFLHATISPGDLAVGSWQRLWANVPDVNTRPDLMSVVSGMVRLEPGVYSVTGSLTLSGAAGTAPRPAALVRAALWDSAGTTMIQALTVISLAGVVSGPASFPITAIFRVTEQSYFGPSLYAWDSMASVADSMEYPTDFSIVRLGS